MECEAVGDLSVVTAREGTLVDSARSDDLEDSRVRTPCVRCARPLVTLKLPACETDS